MKLFPNALKTLQEIKKYKYEKDRLLYKSRDIPLTTAELLLSQEGQAWLMSLTEAERRELLHDD